MPKLIIIEVDIIYIKIRESTKRFKQKGRGST